MWHKFHQGMRELPRSMMHLLRRRPHLPGAPPGTLSRPSAPPPAPTLVTVIDYDAEHYEEHECRSLRELLQKRDANTVTWVNVNSINDVVLLEQLGQIFNIHPLVQEDIAHTGQRPKFEDYDSYLYLVIRMIDYQGEPPTLQPEQMSLIVGKGYLITFQETPGDIFDLIRDRLRQNRGRARRMGADYLAYCLIDAIVDHYFVVLENLGERIELTEERVLDSDYPNIIEEVHHFRTEMIYLRKSIWPVRELIVGLSRSESPLICEEMHVFLRDLHDHTVQVIETIETYREVMSGLFDMHLSLQGNRMNEVMKVLTMISTIFIPLTFVAGVYGMNFKYMPELEKPWGYPLAMAIMLSSGLAMLTYFRHKRWF